MPISNFVVKKINDIDTYIQIDKCIIIMQIHSVKILHTDFQIRNLELTRFSVPVGFHGFL